MPSRMRPIAPRDGEQDTHTRPPSAIGMVMLIVLFITLLISFTLFAIKYGWRYEENDMPKREQLITQNMPISLTFTQWKNLEAEAHRINVEVGTICSFVLNAWHEQRTKPKTEDRHVDN